MNWIILVAIAVILDALRIFIDNYTSDVCFKGRSAAGQKWFYAFVYIIVGIATLLIFGFKFSDTNFTTIGLFVLAGVIGSIGGIPYYKALEIEDSTNLGIFIQTAPILYLVLGWFFLGETFSPMQLVAFAIIMAAPILIIVTTRKRSRKTKLRAIVYAFFCVLLAVICNLMFVKTDDHGFLFANEIAWLFIGKGLGNFIIMLAVPKWRKRFNTVFKANKIKLLKPLIANSVVGLAKDFAYQAALISAPAVAIASAAADSTIPIAIFFMGIVLTLIWPKFGREKLDKKSVLVHLLATALAVIGIIIIQS